MSTPDRIGIRELRQHASQWVQRAAEGHRVEITNRGQLVAALVPISSSDDPLAALERSGQLRPAEEPFDATTLPEPLRITGDTAALLRELRGDE